MGMTPMEELTRTLARETFRPHGLDGAAAARCRAALDGLEHTFGPHGSAALFSAPGRTELGGNHTDHQNGRVLAASVNLDMTAAVGPGKPGLLRLKSEGYDPLTVGLGALERREEETGSSAALLRGLAAAFARRGAALEGLDIYVTSRVPRGSGISSSAAFEVLCAVILNDLFCGGRLSPIELAQMGQWAENVYFGKPCGLMDQMACSVGGVIGIDFADPARPAVTRLSWDMEQAGLALCLIDCGADHADLTEAYAAIPADCRAAAAVCGGETLGDVPYETFWDNLPAVRAACGDRAVLRALHVYAENARVTRQIAALRRGDTAAFLRLVNASGDSSWEYLQNVVPPGDARQALALTIAAAKTLLEGEGAVRVHGGGFAGTVQAFVPHGRLDVFRREIEAVVGRGACHVMGIRPVGGTRMI